MGHTILADHVKEHVYPLVLMIPMWQPWKKNVPFAPK
jgi:hypothetical protein